MNESSEVQTMATERELARRIKGRFLLLSLTVLVLDQWSKWLIELHLPEHGAQPVIPGFFHLTHVRNTGVAFGLFASYGEAAGTWLLTALGLLALAVVVIYFARTPASARLLLLALALVLGGAVGNLLDRVANGAVTDFLAFFLGNFRWPDFNVADSAISIGLSLLVIDALRPRRHPPAAESR